MYISTVPIAVFVFCMKRLLQIETRSVQTILKVSSLTLYALLADCLTGKLIVTGLASWQIFKGSILNGLGRLGYKKLHVLTIAMVEST